MNPHDKSTQQTKQQPSYNPFAPQPTPTYPNANTGTNTSVSYPNSAATYPNANTTTPQQPSHPVQQPKTETNGDSDDSYMDIISLFNNK